MISYVFKEDVNLSGYSTVATAYSSTYISGNLLEIEYIPGASLPLATGQVFKIYRNSTSYAGNLIFKRGIPSSGGLYRPRYPLNKSTGEVAASTHGIASWQPWTLCDQQLKVTLGQTTAATSKNGTLRFYIG